MQLGMKRAQALAEVLRSRGVSANHISTVSYGKTKLLSLENNEDAYYKNRRVEIIFESEMVD